MDLAGDILQELCVFLNITELASTADFPEEFDRLGETLRLVNNFYGSQKSVDKFKLLRPKVIPRLEAN
jgi:hypothetical protein